MKHILLFASALFLSVVLHSQVGINPSGSAPDPSAALDLDYNNKGFLPPRMTTAERDQISNPATGLMIFNIDCAGLNFNAGSPSAPNWVTVSSGNSPTASVGISANPVGAVCSGTSIAYTAAIQNGGTSPTYQWKRNGQAISNATTDTYISAVPVDGDVITCVINSNEACVVGSPATSNVMIENVTPILPASVSIQVSPSGEVCIGTEVTFTATPINGGAIPGYQWKKNGADIGGATSSSYVTTGLVNGDVISCVMTSGMACVSGSPATSNQIAMTVNGSATTSVTYTFTGGVQTWTVPACVTSATIEVWGASGGGSNTGGSGQAGRGGYSKGTLAVTPGETYHIYVGGQGGYSGNNGPNPMAPGGWNGGGNSGACQANAQPAGGGGGSDVRFGGTAFGDRIIVAGGGGGCYSNYDAVRTGGAGGGLTGSNCPNGVSLCGGGSQTAGGQGGVQSGSFGLGGNDGNGSHDCGGGGGGGYYGGGAQSHGAGGGGSGYISGHGGVVPGVHASGKVFTNTLMQSGVQHGNGQVIIAW